VVYLLRTVATRFLATDAVLSSAATAGAAVLTTAAFYAAVAKLPVTAILLLATAVDAIVTSV